MKRQKEKALIKFYELVLNYLQLGLAPTLKHIDIHNKWFVQIGFSHLWVSVGDHGDGGKGGKGGGDHVGGVS